MVFYKFIYSSQVDSYQQGYGASGTGAKSVLSGTSLMAARMGTGQGLMSSVSDATLMQTGQLQGQLAMQSGSGVLYPGSNLSTGIATG